MLKKILDKLFKRKQNNSVNAIKLLEIENEDVINTEFINDKFDNKVSVACPIFTVEQQKRYLKFLDNLSFPLFKVNANSIGQTLSPGFSDIYLINSPTGYALTDLSIKETQYINKQISVNAAIPILIANKMAENDDYAFYCLSFLRNLMLRKVNETIGLTSYRNLTFGKRYNGNPFYLNNKQNYVEIELYVQT